MGVIFEQVFILFVFAAVGYLLSFFKVVKSEHSKLLSSLLVYVFLPCNIFKTFLTNFNIDYLKQNYVMVAASAITVVVIAIASHFLAKLFSKEPYKRSVYEYSMIVPNLGYMGYALSESLLGSAGLMNVMMCGLPMTCFTYTRGFCLLTKRSFTFKKILNPIIVSVLLGVVFGLAGIELPQTVITVLSKSSACMAPLSMLLAGIVVSEFNFKKMFSNIRSYIVVLIRLLIIPSLVGGLFMLLGQKEIAQSAVMVFSMPCGLNAIIFPKLIGEDCETGASLAFISTVLSCITIPLIFTLFGIGLKL